MSRLFLLFTVVPAIELYLLLVIGDLLGPAMTVGLLLLSGVVGAWLARREGAAVLQQLSADLAQGIPPAVRVVEGGLVFAGALLLVTPGVFSDVVGLALLFPPSRRRIAPFALRWISAWGASRATTMRFGQVVSGPGGGQARVFTEHLSARGAATPPPARPPFDHPTA